MHRLMLNRYVRLPVCVLVKASERAPFDLCVRRPGLLTMSTVYTAVLYLLFFCW